MKVGHARKLLGLVAVTADHAAAVAENADDAAVLPVGGAVLKRKLQHSQKVLADIRWNLELNPLFILGTNFRLVLQIGHEARPRTGFELIQHRGFVFRHRFTSILALENSPSRVE